MKLYFLGGKKGTSTEKSYFRHAQTSHGIAHMWHNGGYIVGRGKK